MILETLTKMDRNKIEDKLSDNICNNPPQSNTRLTPGKFTESSECDSNPISNPRNYDEPQEETFFIYSANMDTNSIWNSKPDYKKSVSVPSNSLSNNQDSLNSIWSSKFNSDESLVKPEDTVHIPPISVDISEFEMHENNYQSVLSETGSDVPRRDAKENFSAEERKKMSTMINSHDGWGVKPINQNTPWVLLETENDADNYPDTFSTWLNETPNGAYAWEATKKQPPPPQVGPDWTGAAKSKVNYGTNATKQNTWTASGSGSGSTNDGIWGSNSNAFNSCGVVGSKIPSNATFSTMDSTNSSYMPPSGRSERGGRAPQDHIKSSCWPTDVAPRQMNDVTSMSSSMPTDGFSNSRMKNIDKEIEAYKQFKEMKSQIVDHFQKEQRKIQEIDNNLGNISKLPESQSRALLNELIRHRQTSQQRLQILRTQHESVTHKITFLEDFFLNFQKSMCGSQTPVEKQFIRSENTASSVTGIDQLANKLSSMQVQSSQDFRLDVPEFVPGKKWHGLSQNGKENRSPTIYNKLCPQFSDGCNDSSQQDNNPYPLIWLYIQNLPSHVTMHMIQSFFIQNNNPCIMPIHVNPFSRWMLIRFPNPFSSQKALQALTGKVGQPTLITDQEANIKLQELKGVMAKFVAHQT